MKRNLLLSLLFLFLLGNLLLIVGLFKMFSPPEISSFDNLLELINYRDISLNYFLLGFGIIFISFISAFIIIPSKAK